MKKMLSLLVLSSVLATPAFAAEQNRNAYVGIYGMVGFANTDGVERTPAQPTPLRESSDSGGVNGGAGAWLGYDWASKGLPIRTELAGTWRYRHDMTVQFTQAGGSGQFATKSDISTVDIMASVLYDIPVSWKVKPYVGFGVGSVYSDVETYLLSPGKTDGPGDTNWDLAWQLQAGVNYPITTAWDFRVDYRYADLGEVSTGPVATGETFTADLESHDIRIGATWNF